MSRDARAAEDVFAALQQFAGAATGSTFDGPEWDTVLDAAIALERSLVLARRLPARGPALAPAGRFESPALHAPGRHGRVPLAPATGAIAGIDEQRLSVRVFRTLAAGAVLGRDVPIGARVLLAPRPPAPGDACVVRARDGLFCGEVEDGDRVLGVVEAVIAAA